MAVKNRFRTLLKTLNEDLYEREEALKLCLLAAISGESIFLLGPPGVAKSLIARRIACIFKNAEFFDYLMHRFSQPEEIFGPISIPKLKEGEYQREVEGFLPTATVVFLDEIWKASPPILNTLLTALNEKIFRNGKEVEEIPLQLLVAASNELPPVGEGLEALWDRFIIRYIVVPIRHSLSFEKLVKSETPPSAKIQLPEALKISEEELQQWRETIAKVKFSPEAFEILDQFRYQLTHSKNGSLPPIYVSDRRWQKIAKVLKTAAFMHDRDTVEIIDLFLLPYMLWDRPLKGDESQIEKTIKKLEKMLQKLVEGYMRWKVKRYQENKKRTNRQHFREALQQKVQHLEKEIQAVKDNILVSDDVKAFLTSFLQENVVDLEKLKS